MRALVVGATVGLMAAGSPQVRQVPQAVDLRVASVHITVVDEANGHPIVGAVVTAHSLDRAAPGGSGDDVVEAVTGRSGEALLSGLPAGRVCVSAAKARYQDNACGPNDVARLSTFTLGPAEYRDHVVLRLSRESGIAGTLVDEAGDPVVGIEVTAFRRQWTASGPAFRPAGMATTDDTGAFRVGGLRAGDYLVGLLPQYAEETAGNTSDVTLDDLDEALLTSAPPASRPATFDVGSHRVVAVDAASPVPPLAESGAQVSLAYGPTFAPGLPARLATVISLGLGEWKASVDLRLTPTPLARITGQMIPPAGIAVRQITVFLVPDDPGDRAVGREFYQATTDRSGAFSIPFVPTGQYLLEATATPELPPVPAPSVSSTIPTLFGEQPVTVAAEVLPPLAVPLEPAARVTGRVIVASGPKPAADFRGFTLSATSDELAMSSASTIRTDRDGLFSWEHLRPGRYAIRVTGLPTLALLSATADGRDIADGLLSVTPGQRINDLILTLTDRLPSLAGTIPVEAVGVDDSTWVIVFSADRSFWTSVSRRVIAQHPSNLGSFEVRDLVPGDYFVVAAHLEPLAWLDPSVLESLVATATRVTLAEGEHKTITIQRMARQH